MLQTLRPRWEMSAGHRTLALVLFGIVLVAALAYIAREARAERSW